MKRLLLPAVWLALVSIIFAQAPAPPPPETITKEQTVYVPFEKLEEVFEKQERGVFLPYREFLELWNKLNLPDKLKEKEPPVEGVLASAHYAGKVEGDVAVIAAKLSFEALKDGWSRLALGSGELSIADAKSTALLNVADGKYEVIFPKKGAYQLDATIYGRVAREQGRSHLRLKLPKTAVSQFELTIPDKNLEFELTPAAAFSATENPDGTTRLIAYFGAAQELNLSWVKRTGETALAPLLFADAALDVRLSAGAVRTDATVSYRILRAGVSAFELLVGAGEQVLAVEGENLREWKIEPSEGGQKLHVALHTPAKQSYALRIKLESALPALPQQVKLPLLEAKNVERQSGSVVVSADPELVVEIGQLQGLTQQAEPEANKARGGIVGSFRYLRMPFAGTLAVSETQPQVEVTSDTLLTVEPDALQLRAVFRYLVKKAGIFDAHIELPAGWTQAEASGEQIDSSSVREVAGKRVIDVKFTQRRTGAFSLQVKSELPRAKADEPVTVPVFVPQKVERHEARVALAIHTSLKANTTDKGDLREDDIRGFSIPHIVAPDVPGLPQVPGLEPLPGAHGVAANTPLTLGFRYRGAAKPAQVQFELRKPRVSAEVLARMEVREALVRHTWTIVYNVEYAGVNEFAVEVPKEIADDVHIDGANIKERTKSETKNAQGQPTGTFTWRVALQDKVLGRYELTLSHETPRGAVKPGVAVAVTLPEIKALDVFRETGQVAVVKDGNVEITKTEPKGLETVDPQELAPQLQRDGIFLAYKYSAHPIALRLDVSKNIFLEVPLAVVTHAVLTSVIAEDTAETAEVIYWVRNNAQQFFSVALPGSETRAAKLLSDVFVNGEPQQPSRRPDKNELLIRLPARQESNEAFPVRFLYEVPSANPGKRLGWSGEFKIAPPTLNAEVLHTTWTLYLPAEYRYLRFSGSMRERSGARGWERFWYNLSPFVPQTAPALPQQDRGAQPDPPELPPTQKAGFDTQLQKDGVRVTLRRLDAPAPIVVAYRGRNYAATFEAILCALAFFAGASLLRASRQMKFAFFMLVGIGALIIAGAVDPRAARKWQAIYLGAFLALVVWLLCAVRGGFAAWLQRRRAKREAKRAAKLAQPYPPAQPPSATPPEATPPTSGEAAP